jgi:hypothetical protein
MNNISKFSFLLLCICFLALTKNVLSQTVDKSRYSSYYTYIYRITNLEAKEIYKNNNWDFSPEFFHTKIDSFPTDSSYQKQLSPGHYLKVYSQKEQLYLDIASIYDFDVIAKNNEKDLCIQVVDTSGTPVGTATLELNGRKIKFDKKSKTFRVKKSNKKGFLSVTHNNHVLYSELSRMHNNPKYKRAYYAVAYRSPVKYIWRPVNFIIKLPIHGYKSIRWRYSVGSIYRIKRFAIKSFYSAARLIDKSYNQEYYDFINKKQSWGYMVFNKPKYRPGDTVKYKAYILNSKGKPFTKELNPIINNYNNYKRNRISFKPLKSHHAGCYSGEFVLNDSLNLKLDKGYTLELENGWYNAICSGTFKYEDYELFSTKLKSRVERKTQYANQENIVYISATDENELPLLGAEAKIVITTSGISKTFDNLTFVPNTLLTKTIPISDFGETKFIVNDSIFPKANINYKIEVEIRTAENDNKTYTHHIDYYFYKHDITAKLENDSIQFQSFKNDSAFSTQATLTEFDSFGNEIDSKTISLPYSTKINPYYTKYRITTPKQTKDFKLHTLPADIKCYTYRNKDSLVIQIDNPRKLVFNYNIYKDNREIERGAKRKLYKVIKTSSKKIFHLSIQYLWGGKVNTSNYSIPLNTEEMLIDVSHPKIIYPGKKTPITITVTDNNGNPIPEVDLTAMSLTKKFNYSLPVISVLGINSKPRKQINSFSIHNYTTKDSEKQLDYKEWNEIAKIDSIEYYKFLYPGKKVYQSTIPNSQGYTQFSPYYIENGVPKKIHVIYINHKPVYFSWANIGLPYSFKVPPYHNNIQLRVHNKIIELIDVNFEPGVKNIFSISDSCHMPKVSFKKMPTEFADYEKSLFNKYTASYRNNFSKPNAYIVQRDKYFPVDRRSRIFGPVSQYYMRFQTFDDYSLGFIHESGFEYEFGEKLLKMRSKDHSGYYPKYLGHSTHVNLTDSILTEKILKERWNRYQYNQKYNSLRYYKPKYTTKGNGALEVKGDFQKLYKRSELKYFHTIIKSLNGDGFYRVYPEIPRTIHDLRPGEYQLFFVHWDGDYFQTDTFNILGNGKNIYRPDSLQYCIEDNIERFSSLIWDFAYQKKYNSGQNTVRREAFREYYDIYYGDGATISGKIICKEDGSNLPGVCVVVKGTTIGTISDFDGVFNLNAPPNATLVVSFVGMITKEVKTNDLAYLEIELEAETIGVDEVVVTAMGVTRQSDFTSSVETIKSESLQAVAVGMKVEKNLPISIRGVSSIKAEKPLIVLDGVPFLGDLTQLEKSNIVKTELKTDEATKAIYGARAANGVLYITTKQGLLQKQSLEENLSMLDMDNIPNTIRSNFSDYAIWQPTLLTNEKGQATFSTTFPDDITSWDTYVIAMKGNKKLATYNGQIKSFKPLMARIHTPRFLISGDTAYAIGKIANYTSDSIQLTTEYKVDNQTKKTNSCLVSNSMVDSLELSVSNTDTTTISYTINTAENYFDGEERKIPVFHQGIEAVYGSFHILNNDTNITIYPDTIKGKLTLRAHANQLTALSQEIKGLTKYKHSCNEQLSSKLIALLAHQQIAEYNKEPFKAEKTIKKIIKLLVKNQNDEGCWGWWGKSSTSIWVSQHVLKALSKAKTIGYSYKINTDQMAKTMVTKLEEFPSYTSNIDLLTILKEQNLDIDYAYYIDSIKLDHLASLGTRLRLIYLKKLCNYSPYEDFNQYQRQTMLGSVYYADASNFYFNFHNGKIQNTVLAYKILKMDSIPNLDLLQNIRNYFFEYKQNYTYNTYEMANVIETILPDLLKKEERVENTSLTINGKFSTTITTFPFDTTLINNDTLRISKTGTFPVFFTAYKRYWDSYPARKWNDFEIESSFSNGNNYLKSGEKEKLIVKLNVKKDAKYVMIEIPIPAGCSYSKKPQNYGYEVHHEYHKNKVVIYCEKLKAKEYTFYIDLLPRYNGTYTLNPAKVELMYFPTFNANNSLRKVSIRK